MPNSRPEQHIARRLVAAALAGCLMAAIWPGASLAAGSKGGSRDSSQPVRIEADHAELNRNRNTSIYTGSVKVDQGRLHLTGNRLVVTRDQGAGSNFTGVMTGNPAHLVQQPTQSGQAATYAHAQQIQYDSKTQVLHLKGSAYVRQGGNTLSGESVTYNTRARQIEANRSDKQRVHITLYPNSPPSAQRGGKSSGTAKQGHHP